MNNLKILHADQAQPSNKRPTVFCQYISKYMNQFFVITEGIKQNKNDTLATNKHNEHNPG